jgi:hypothetical protein
VQQSAPSRAAAAPSVAPISEGASDCPDEVSEDEEGDTEGEGEQPSIAEEPLRAQPEDEEGPPRKRSRQ